MPNSTNPITSTERYPSMSVTLYLAALRFRISGFGYPYVYISTTIYLHGSYIPSGVGAVTLFVSAINRRQRHSRLFVVFICFIIVLFAFFCFIHLSVRLFCRGFNIARCCGSLTSQAPLTEMPEHHPLRPEGGAGQWGMCGADKAKKLRNFNMSICLFLGSSVCLSTLNFSTLPFFFEQIFNIALTQLRP